MSYEYGPSGSSDNQNNGSWAPVSQGSYPGGQQQAPQPGSQGPYPDSQGSAVQPGSQPSGPYSQGSAPYPNNQGSASYAGSQGSASYAGSQGSASYAGSQPSAPYQGAPSQGDQNSWGSPEQRPQSQPGLFGRIFDFTFESYATPSLIKIIYILGMVLGVLQWLGYSMSFFIAGLVTGSSSYTDDMAPLWFGAGFVSLIFGLVPLFFWILSLRMSLEFVMANVRTQEDTKVIRAKLEA